VIADLQARLFRAVAANDLGEAASAERSYPSGGDVFYRRSFVDMHTA